MKARPAPTPPQSRCARCARLRRALAAVALLAAVLLGLRLAFAPAEAASADTAAPPAVAPALPALAPPPPAVAAPAAAPGASAASAVLPAAAPAGAGPAAELRLVYRTVGLPSARRGLAYGPHLLVRGGTPPYRLAVVEGPLPPGLQLDAEGRLGGTPTATGGYRFVLEVEDASLPGRALRQPYVLYVNPPPRPAAATPPASAPPPALTALAPSETDLTADAAAGQPASYLLTSADVGELLGEAPVAAGSAAAAPEPPEAAGAVFAPAAAAEPALPGPTVEQLRAMLQPLVDVEFPTRAQFLVALDAGRCAYYRQHLRQVAAQRGLAVDPRGRALEVDDSCPPPQAPPATRARPAADGAKPLRQFHDELLPEAMRSEVLRLATKRHPLDAARPLRLDGGGCGCSRAGNVEGEEVIGFLPWWLADEAPEAPLGVDFSLFTRLAYMGVVLGDDGSWLQPPGWDGRLGNVARQARRHDTRLDLVLYRSGWASLLSRPPGVVEETARSAARNAVRLADAHRSGLGARLGALLLPGWRESPYVYDGLTVFFEDSPTEGPQRQAFEGFLRLFLTQLVAEMQATGRAYRASIVVPGSRLAETGAYAFPALMELVEAAEKPHASWGVSAEGRQAYRGSTDLRLAFLVLLDEPAGAAATRLRARIDAAPSLAGHRRNALLESMAPLLLHPRGAQPLPLAPLARRQFSEDLGYIRWTYGSVALWPLPTAGRGAGEAVDELLSQHYGQPPGALTALCELACPNRLPLRLLLQALALALLGGIGLYAANCRVRRLGRPYLAMLWAGALATLAVAFVVFSCDPALAQAREQNHLLYGLIVLLLLGGAYVVFRPRVGVP